MTNIKKGTKKISFWWFYLGFVIVLVGMMIGAVVYVNGLLHEYEETQPSYYVEQTMEGLVADAASGQFWNKYFLPEVQPGVYETGRNIKAEYLSFFAEEELTYAAKSGAHEEDTLLYTIKNGEKALAEVKLRALGPAETKLAVLNFREWQVEYVKPLLEQKEYTLSVPSSFGVTVNGVALTAEDGVSAGGSEIVYTLSGLYMEPVFEIADWNGNPVNYAIKGEKVVAEFYSYDLTLPNSLTIQVNGEVIVGEPLDRNRTTYSILELKKPAVVIADHYGNAVNYEGQTNVPLTYTVITADSRQKVLVDGGEVPAECVRVEDNPEFEQLKDYVENLPQICEYNIAVLKADAEITVADEKGQTIAFEKGQSSYDFIGNTVGADEVPEEVAKEIDVLQVAQSWSLFMSDDKPFAELAQYMIKDSYQYKVAHKYANSVDITFISGHVLLDPAFTGNQVTNFTWITEECFSVDISFVKHMRLKNGKLSDDVMNDRFYFVLYDATNDKVDNPTWKMASMKEIVNNAE